MSTLTNPAADCFSEDDYQFLKFHGIYQQDDRDKRKTSKHDFHGAQAISGRIVIADQYLVFDRLATECQQNAANHDAAGISISRSGEERFGRG